MSKYAVKTYFKPYLLKGHERSITNVKYNEDGDLIFSSSKDVKPCVWNSTNGERIGTFNFHSGTVWDIDPSWDSSYVLTASADTTAALFNMKGEVIAVMPYDSVCKVCKWGEGNDLYATAIVPKNSRESGYINLYHFPTQEELQNNKTTIRGQTYSVHKPFQVIAPETNERCTSLVFTYGNEYIIAGFESGKVVLYNVATGQAEKKVQMHNAAVTRVTLNREKTMCLSSSKDTTAKLFDPYTLEVQHTYNCSVPVNGAAISPTHPHVILGGGQDAQSVTTTSSEEGKFEARFFHAIYEEEFGKLKGHFGPINALDIHPAGISFVTGGEDGYIRLNHFDTNYLCMPELKGYNSPIN